MAFVNRDYYALFMMMFTQMAFKQVGKNLFDHFYPIIMYKKKLQYLKDEFQEFIFHEDKEYSQLQQLLKKNTAS